MRLFASAVAMALVMVSSIALAKSVTVKIEIAGVYRRNVFSIVHGLEGNWFRATADWEKSVRPLLQRAKADVATYR